MSTNPQRQSSGLHLKGLPLLEVETFAFEDQVPGAKVEGQQWYNGKHWVKGGFVLPKYVMQQQDKIRSKILTDSIKQHSVVKYLVCTYNKYALFILSLYLSLYIIQKICYIMKSSSIPQVGTWEKTLGCTDPTLSQPWPQGWIVKQLN